METIVIPIGPVTFSERCKDYLNQHFQVKTLRKDEFLVQPGQICTDYSFVESGLLHACVPSYRGMMTTQFFVSPDLCLSVVSFFKQTVAVEYIQALDDTKLYQLSYGEMLIACKEFPEFQQHMHTSLLSNRLREGSLGTIHLEKPRKRYEWLNDYYPQASDSHRQHIAKYIGLTAEQLESFDKRNRKRKSSIL